MYCSISLQSCDEIIWEKMLASARIWRSLESWGHLSHNVNATYNSGTLLWYTIILRRVLKKLVETVDLMLSTPFCLLGGAISLGIVQQACHDKENITGVPHMLEIATDVLCGVVSLIGDFQFTHWNNRIDISCHHWLNEHFDSPSYADIYDGLLLNPLLLLNQLSLLLLARARLMSVLIRENDHSIKHPVRVFLAFIVIAILICGGPALLGMARWPSRIMELLTAVASNAMFGTLLLLINRVQSQYTYKFYKKLEEHSNNVEGLSDKVIWERKEQFSRQRKFLQGTLGMNKICIMPMIAYHYIVVTGNINKALIKCPIA